jgi:hypothetical protein
MAGDELTRAGIAATLFISSSTGAKVLSGLVKVC